MNSSTAVQFNNVSKSFGTRSVLQDVSFSIAEGEAICILGRSGTGKSVTLKLLIGLLIPDSGTVFVEDDEISRLHGTELSRVRRKIGYLFQSAALFDSFTVGDNLRLPLTRFGNPRSKVEIDEAVLAGLRQVGLDKDVDKHPVELSGGMRKRAGLARALILSPKLLLVDEPSSGLDRITAAEIDNLLLKVRDERKTTMIVVTHDVRGARKLADKIAVLDQGVLVGFGTAKELEQSRNETVRELVSEG